MSFKNAKKAEAETKQPPVAKVKVGLISGSIWENKTEKGTFYNVTFERRYRDGRKATGKPPTVTARAICWNSPNARTSPIRKSSRPWRPATSNRNRRRLIPRAAASTLNIWR